MERNPS